MGLLLIGFVLCPLGGSVFVALLSHSSNANGRSKTLFAICTAIGGLVAGCALIQSHYGDVPAWWVILPESLTGWGDVSLTYGLNATRAWLLLLVTILAQTHILRWRSSLEEPGEKPRLPQMLGLIAGVNLFLIAFDAMSLLTSMFLMTLFGMQRVSSDSDTQSGTPTLLCVADVLIGLGFGFIIIGEFVINASTNGTPELPATEIKLIFAQLAELTAVNPVALAWWRTFAPWSFLCLTLGFAIKLGLFPLQPRDKPSSLTYQLLLIVGLLGLLEYVIPLFPEILERLRSDLLAFLICSAGVTLWFGCQCSDHARTLAYRRLCLASWIACGLFTSEVSGLAGSLMLLTLSLLLDCWSKPTSDPHRHQLIRTIGAVGLVVPSYFMLVAITETTEHPIWLRLLAALLTLGLPLMFLRQQEAATKPKPMTSTSVSNSMLEIVIAGCFLFSLFVPQFYFALIRQSLSL